jgi:hypothetical protein
MQTKDKVINEKQKVWRLLERILGPTERVVSYRSDWRIHRESDTSVLVTFSKLGQLFYDVSRKDLEQFAEHKHAFFIFLAGSHKDAFIVPGQELREEIRMHKLIASQKYEDYKLHLVRDYRGTYFREIPTLNLALYANQYTSLL